MGNLLEKLKDLTSGGFFKSQDSKYFILTAFKVTLVPIISFSIIFYSLWNVIEMNYAFFVANGFSSGDDFKEAFIDHVLLNINDYYYYFGAIIIGVFMVGLLVSHLALRPFEEIQDFCIDVQDDPDLEFEVNKLNAKKIIYQGAQAFFTYLNYLRMGESVDGDSILPQNLVKMKKPSTDKVFLLQYVSIIAIITLVTNIIFYTFTNELYQEIVESGVTLLKGNSVVAKFMQSQGQVLFNIYAVAMGLNVILYLGLSKNIIKSVDGVSYAFCRDFIQIIQGNHRKRIFPRFSDPGKEAANACNEYLDLVMADYEEEEVIPVEVEEPVVAKASPVKENLLQLNPEPKVKEQVVQQQAKHSELEKELPPSFIEQKMVAGSDIHTFNITTPKGYKVENLNEGQVLKILTELEKKS